MKRAAAIALLATVLGLLISCFIALPAHSAETKTIHSEALGFTKQYSNPNTYLFGAVAAADLITDEDRHHYTNIRFQPYGTIALYDETVLFCGNAAPNFEGKSNPVIVVYQTSVHRMYQGVGCHILLGVFEVKGVQ